jgi:hypothetical protein
MRLLSRPFLSPPPSSPRSPAFKDRLNASLNLFKYVVTQGFTDYHKDCKKAFSIARL